MDHRERSRAEQQHQAYDGDQDPLCPAAGTEIKGHLMGPGGKPDSEEGIEILIRVQGPSVCGDGPSLVVRNRGQKHSCLGRGDGALDMGV